MRMVGLILVTACGGTPTPAPTPVQTPEERVAEAFEVLNGAAFAEEGGVSSAREVCTARQTAALEKCGEAAESERASCEVERRTLLKVCEEIRPEISAAFLGLIFCDGQCATVPIVGAKPTPIGACTGVSCAAPGAVCDPGWFWDCHCADIVRGPPLFQSPVCSCDCQ